ncbi:MAG: glycine cleavage system protein GcvH [Bacteroidales bacterium]|nr:glycine cleavage system protein GcvH [Bacteroidales bacterium]
MNVPENLKYSQDHEWIRVDGDFAFIGVTDYAQSNLGDIVFVEVETVGEELNKGEAFGNVEAVKAVEELYMPIGGELVEFNESLEDAPELVNTDPYGEGWMIKIKLADAGDLDNLLDDTAYKALIG